MIGFPCRLSSQLRRFNRVPLLLGSNENGGSIFEPMLPIVLPGVRLPVKRFPETLDIAMRYFFQDNVSKVEARRSCIL